MRLEDRRERTKPRRQLWRHLRTAMKLLWRRPLVSVTVVPVLPDGRVVLVRRVDSDLWGLPGGIIDWGEDVPTAAARELAEEAGLDLLSIERLLGVYSSPERDPRTHAISIAVVARVAGESSIGDPLEVSEIHAFSREALPFGYLAHDGEQQLGDFLADRTSVS